MKGKFERRHFIKTLPIAALTYPSLSCSRTTKAYYEKGLWEDFTESEKKHIADSPMAKGIIKWHKKRYSCAEAIYFSALEYLEKPLEYGAAALGYGGGMAKEDLCGFLTGGYMAIGVSSQTLHPNHDDAYKYNEKLCLQFWDWFEKRAPVHCVDLLKYYSDEQFNTMAIRVAIQVEQLITPARRSSQHTG
jgi:hypothetical protein